ncbi:hypothetical protein FRC02_010624 [Tulasnella sp. 418]|nr:hypothetical protein FRC02_010624 [Tulasnella sp. 418]
MATSQVVSAFEASFHMTLGNTLDWSTSVSDEISLTGVEFSTLPSGLHGVEQDVVYFHQDGYYGVSVFRNRRTGEQGRKGVKMTATGLLVTCRPWLHVHALKNITDRDALQAHFDQHKASPSELASITYPDDTWESETSSASPSTHPLLHLPHFLRLVGPSFITLFKHVLARKRVLLYSRAPVEATCLLAMASIDTAFGAGRSTETPDLEGVGDTSYIRDDRPPTALGIVGLIDIEKLEAETKKGLGWVACTTDAIFLEKPHLYDLIVDLTSISFSSPLTSSSNPSRPTFYISKPASSAPSSSSSKSNKPPPYKLSQVRFTFSDLRIWATLDKVLRESESSVMEHVHFHHNHHQHSSSKKEKEKEKSASRWSDASFLSSGWWKIYSYEDVCMACVNVWRVGQGNGVGGIRLEGEDDVILSGSSKAESTSQQPGPSIMKFRPKRKASDISKHTSDSSSSSSSSGSSQSGSSAFGLTARFAKYASHPPILQTALVLLEILHAQASFWVDGMEFILSTLNETDSSDTPPPSSASSSWPRSKPPSSKKSLKLGPNVISETRHGRVKFVWLTPGQMAMLQLSTFSELDSAFASWLGEGRFVFEAQSVEGEENGERVRLKVVVRRSWKDVILAAVGW